jgi:hypothetical protein
VDLECRTLIALADGHWDMGGPYISMKSLPNGMMAVVRIKDRRLAFLEFPVYGGDHWDGSEED